MLKNFRNELISKIKLYHENLNNALRNNYRDELITLFDEHTETIINIVTEVEKIILDKDVPRREEKDWYD